MTEDDTLGQICTNDCLQTFMMTWILWMHGLRIALAGFSTFAFWYRLSVRLFCLMTQ